MKQTAFNSQALLKIGFLISLLAFAGSLFFSEVLRHPPCVLCWYQTFCIYPLMVIFGVGILRDDRNAVTYALPLVLIGSAISVYHCLLMYGIIPEAIAPCKQGVSCTTKQVEYFGFVTIPLLSAMTFAFLTALSLVLFNRRNSHEE